MSLTGFGFLAVLLLKLGLKIARGRVSTSGMSVDTGCVRVLPAWLGSVEEDEVRHLVRYYERCERARTSFLSFSSC